MPQAEPFSAFNLRGSGFPFCIRKIDKTLYTYAVDMTLEQASRFFYNVYSVTHPALTADNNGSNVATLPAGDLVRGAALTEDNVTQYDNSVTPPPKPREYVCGAGASYHEVFDDIYSVGIRLTPPGIVKFYDGDTTNEANHTGWGVENVLSIHAGIQAYDVNQIIYRSYGELIGWAADPLDPFPPDSWWHNQGFLGYYYLAPTKPDSVTETTLADAPILKVEYSGRDANFAGNTWTVAEPTALDFYTYP